MDMSKDSSLAKQTFITGSTQAEQLEVDIGRVPDWTVHHIILSCKVVEPTFGVILKYDFVSVGMVKSPLMVINSQSLIIEYNWFMFVKS